METGTSRTKLDPDGEERFVSLRRALGVTSFGINQLVLEPRQRGRIHRHERQEEVYLVLEGTLTLVVEGEEQAVERGELVRVAPEVRRQLVNRGPERLVMVALGGDGEHTGRDGQAFTSWDDTQGAPPQEIPLPDDLPELARRQRRRLVQPEGRALVVAAELEAPVARLRLLVALDVHVLHDAPELAHALARRVDVVDREEDVGRRSGVAAVDPGASLGRVDHEAVARGPGLEAPPEEALVERPTAVGIVDAQLDEGHAGTGAAPTAASRRAADTSRWRRPKASAKRKAMRLRKHGR